jgi:PAS domain S-box-containing protein
MLLAERDANGASRPGDCPSVFCCLIFIIALFCPSMAMASHRLADDYIRTDFTVEDGLPDNVVNAIVQTANGLLWVGTESGLVSFDGREFSPINIRVPGSPPQGAVNTLAEASNGDLWVGTDAGVVLIPRMALDQFDPAKLTFYRLGSRATNKVVVVFQTREGVLWAGTDHGLFRQDAGRFVLVTQTQELSIGRISQTLDGHLLLITSRGFLEWDGHRVMEHPGLAASFGVRDDEIFSVLQDRSGATWYCTSKGIARQVGHSFTRLHPLDLWKAAAFRAYEDPQGSVWIASSIGLYRVTGDLLETPAPGLHARFFFAGKDGELWVGTNGRGLVHLKRRVARMFTRADGLQNEITMAVLSTHDGKVWAGGNCGLAVFDGTKFKSFNESNGLLNSCVWSLAEDKDGNLWIGTWGGGLFRFRDEHFVQYSIEQGLASKIVFQIIVAHDDSLWIATPEGLSHMKNGHIRNYSTVDGLYSNQVLSIYQDPAGGIWAQTRGGIDRLAGERFVPFSSAQPRDGPFPVRLIEDSLGDLYAANSPKGISLIQDNKLITVNEDLQVLDMVESPQHDLWFSGRNGIIRIALNDLKRSVTDHEAPLNYVLFDRTDGLNSIQCSVGAPNITIAPDGKLWVATVNGLAMIDLTQLPRTSRKPEVFVGAVTIGKNKVLAGRQLRLDPGTHHIELHLEAVDVASPEKIRLQYRMDGVDANWLDADASRTAIYTTIPPGTHAFHVRATSSSGVWDPVGIVYSVTQRPYFYQTTWFRVLEVLACLGFVLIFIRLRIRQAAAKIEARMADRLLERDRIEQELRDTIDAIPVLCGRLSPDGSVDFFNRRTLEYYGSRSDEMTGFKWANYIHPEDFPRLQSAMEQAFRCGRPLEIETRNRRANGEYRWLQHRIVPQFDNRGNIHKWYGTSVDIEDRKRAEDAVLEQRVLERTRIARELHDTLLQTFQSTLLIMGSAANLLEEGSIKERLELALEKADRAISEGRDAIQGLRLGAERPDDLIRSLHALGEGLVAVESHGDAPAFYVEVSGLPICLYPAVSHEVFSIGSEAIRNAFRHANARHIQVQFRYGAEEFVLAVIDDGTGIDPIVLNNGGREGHFGLAGMRERARIVHGELTSWSELRVGTKIELKIPAIHGYTAS